MDSDDSIMVNISDLQASAQESGQVNRIYRGEIVQFGKELCVSIADELRIIGHWYRSKVW